MKTIKNTLKLAMIAFVLVFTSCSKDDSLTEDNAQMEEPTIQEQLISGKWFIQATSNDGDYNECERNSYFHFVDEDTFTVQRFFEDGDNCMSNAIEVYSYFMITDETFKIQDSTDPLFTIETITANQLILKLTIGVDNKYFFLFK